MTSERKELARAIAARASAEKAVATAKAVAAKAADYERGIEEEVRQLRIRDEAVKRKQGDIIADALRAGKAPPDASAGFGEIGVKLADAEARLASARLAGDSVNRDVRQALENLDAARERVLDETRLAMVKEAKAMVAEIEVHETEAAKLRARLGLDVGPVGSLRPLPERVAQVIAKTALTTNSPGWFMMERSVPVWGLFAEALGKDPEAELVFDE
jgi:hypothetical protein